MKTKTPNSTRWQGGTTQPSGCRVQGAGCTHETAKNKYDLERLACMLGEKGASTQEEPGPGLHINIVTWICHYMTLYLHLSCRALYLLYFLRSATCGPKYFIVFFGLTTPHLVRFCLVISSFRAVVSRCTPLTQGTTYILTQAHGRSACFVYLYV